MKLDQRARELFSEDVAVRQARRILAEKHRRRAQSSFEAITGKASASISMAIRPNDIAKPFDRSLRLQIAMAGKWSSPLGLGNDLAIDNANFQLAADSSGAAGMLLGWARVSWDLNLTEMRLQAARVRGLQGAWVLLSLVIFLKGIFHKAF